MMKMFAVRNQGSPALCSKSLETKDNALLCFVLCQHKGLSIPKQRSVNWR